MLKTKTEILNIKPYVQGKSKASGGAKLIKLSSNENPLGCSPRAIEAFKKFADFHRYPDGAATELRHEIAKLHGLNPDNIICGAGSDEILELIAYAYCGEGDEVIYTEHGFLVYPIAAMSAGAKPVAVPEKNLTTDVDAILAGVNERTKIVYIANPNNPTGTYIPKKELQKLREKLPQNILLVIDNAYAEFVTAPDYSDGNEIAEATENTITTRTFSKIYGLANLRLGWGFAHPKIIDVLNRIRPPFNVGAATQMAGIAAVNDQDFVQKSIEHNTKWRDWLTAELKKFQLEVVPSQGNFLLVKFADAKQTFEKLSAKGIIVREMASYGLPEYLRISVGTEEEMRALVDVIDS